MIIITKGYEAQLLEPLQSRVVSPFFSNLVVLGLVETESDEKKINDL